VTAKEGMLRVEGNGPAINVAKGKTITVVPEANAPQGGGRPPGGVGRCCGSNVWGIAATVVAGGALIFAAVAESRAGKAEDNAAAATTAANAATSAANSATAAASAAAAAASAAAATASAAAAAAAAEANSLGCALNTLANEQGQKSPYTPPAGESCS
jgi:hypothetical protein